MNKNGNLINAVSCAEFVTLYNGVIKIFLPTYGNESVTDNGGFENKLIGKFLGTFWYTFITEEIFNILRKFHNPKIDFALLNQLTVQKIKDVKSEVFTR